MASSSKSGPTPVVSADSLPLKGSLESTDGFKKKQDGLKDKNYSRSSLRESTRSYATTTSNEPKLINDSSIPSDYEKLNNDLQESKPPPTNKMLESSTSDGYLEDNLDEQFSDLSVLDEEQKPQEQKKYLKSFVGYEGKERESGDKEIKMPSIDLLKLTQEKDQQKEKDMLTNKPVTHLPTRMLALPHTLGSKKIQQNRGDPIVIPVNVNGSQINGMNVNVNGINGLYPTSTLPLSSVSTVPNPSTTVPSKSRSRKKSKEGRGRPAGRDKGFLPDHYKTEICRTHRLLGYCEYSENCQFAHGIEELRPRRYGVKYKTQLCKNYHLEGHCRFGSRCKFIHDEQRIQVGDREFWLISPAENLVRVEVVENPQRATQLKQLLDTDTATYRVDLPSSGTLPTVTGTSPTSTTSTLPPTSTLTTIPTSSLPDPTTSSMPTTNTTNLTGTINPTPTMSLPRPSPPQTITLPTNTHIPITPQSPSIQQQTTTQPFYTSTGYFQPATATSPSTGFPPAPSSTTSPGLGSPLNSIPPSPGFLYSNLTGVSGISSPGGSVPHTPVGHYFGYGGFSPQVTYSPFDYIQMGTTLENRPIISPLSSASASPSQTPLHMSPIVPLTRTLHQTFSLRRASSQPQSQQGSPAGMIRGRTLTTQLPPIP